MQIIDKFKELNQTIKDQQKQFIESATAEINKGLVELFDKYPELESFVAYGYASYWTDDGPGDYYMNDVTYINNKRWNREELSVELNKALESADEFIHSIDNEIWQLLGPDTKFTFTRNGLQMEEYGDHD